jgi:hypothetical protein
VPPVIHRYNCVLHLGANASSTITIYGLYVKPLALRHVSYLFLGRRLCSNDLITLGAYLYRNPSGEVLLLSRKTYIVNSTGRVRVSILHSPNYGVDVIQRLVLL